MSMCQRNSKRMKCPSQAGFTLLEILIALFVFTILSTMLVGALHNVISIHARTESHAERLHELQKGLLVLSLDVEQAVSRSIIDDHGKEQPAFIGHPQNFIFTHAGVANPSAVARMSTLARSGYSIKGNQLVRETWSALDQAPNTKSFKRVILNNISEARFEYLDKDGRFLPDWPKPDKKDQILPRAVRFIFEVPGWGKMSQIYVISAK